MSQSQQSPSTEDNGDLLNILNDLDNIDTPGGPPESKPNLGAKYFKQKVSQPASQLASQPQPQPAPEVAKPGIEIKAEESKQVINFIGSQTNQGTIPGKPTDDIGAEAAGLSSKILTNFGIIQSALWDKLNADRTQIDDFIKLFTDRIHDPDATKSCYVEGLTALLNIKAGTSVSATKMLDSIAKMTAAIKNIKADGGSGPDLASLLGDSGAGFDPEQP